MNIIQWNFIGNFKILIQENAIENIVCEMATILYQSQCFDNICYPAYLVINLECLVRLAYSWIVLQVGEDICGFRELLWKMCVSWWRHQMEIFSALLALCGGNSPETVEFPSQRPVTQSFDVISDLRLNKRLSKQSRRRWFETPSRSLWSHCNVRIWVCLIDDI